RLFKRVGGAVLQQLLGAPEGLLGTREIAGETPCITEIRPGAGAQVLYHGPAAAGGVEAFGDADRQLTDLDRLEGIGKPGVEAALDQQLADGDPPQPPL